MTDRPILFSGPMVHALLEGRKTQTRQLAWGKWKGSGSAHKGAEFRTGATLKALKFRNPTIWQKVKPGDRLWVRETWGKFRSDPDPRWPFDHSKIVYRADDKYALGSSNPWRPSTHLPRWASRLTLVVTDVRRERVQEISDIDCRAEGFDNDMGKVEGYDVIVRDMREKFIDVIGRDAWNRNSEVVALTFTVHQCNIDSMSEAA